LLRARQREARRGQTAERLFGFFRPDDANSNPNKKPRLCGAFYMAASPCVRNDQNAQTTNYRHLMHTLNNYLTRSKAVKLHINF
jgi:hypothetical protein